MFSYQRLAFASQTILNQLNIYIQIFSYIHQFLSALFPSLGLLVLSFLLLSSNCSAYLCSLQLSTYCIYNCFTSLSQNNFKYGQCHNNNVEACFFYGCTTPISTMHKNAHTQFVSIWFLNWKFEEIRKLSTNKGYRTILMAGKIHSPHFLVHIKIHLQILIQYKFSASENAILYHLN